MSRGLWLAAALLAVVGAASLYTHRLGDAPAYISLDEAHFGNHAHSLATTGRDLNGNRLPLFISLEDPLGDRPVLAWGTTWYHPAGFYAIAAVLSFAPMSEWAIRLPMAVIGVLNIVLIYLVAKQWFGDRGVAVLAAILLACTPAHFILSRMALDYLLPLPFTLGWLLALGRLRRQPTTLAALIAGFVLGIGCYSYVSSWLMMPAYLLISAAVVWKDAGRADLIRPLAMGFGTPLLALLPWLLLHPDMPGNIIAQYQAGETRRSLVTAIATGTDVAGALRTTLAAYWSYFNPSFLFGAGGTSRLVSTGTTGVWPAAMAVLLIVAAVRLLRRTLTLPEAVLALGLLLAPIPAALKGEPFAIQRAVSLMPFGVLLAAASLVGLRRRGVLERAVVVVALATLPVQFSGFVTDYFGDYRERSAAVVDPTAFRETAHTIERLVSKEATPVIALTSPLYDVSAKWRFYATARHRVDWLSSTRYFSGDLAEIADLPPGTLAVVETVSLAAHDGWQIAAAPRAIFGATPLTILRRE